jgi:hypothetical protein
MVQIRPLLSDCILARNYKSLKHLWRNSAVGSQSELVKLSKHPETVSRLL